MPRAHFLYYVQLSEKHFYTFSNICSVSVFEEIIITFVFRDKMRFRYLRSLVSRIQLLWAWPCAYVQQYPIIQQRRHVEIRFTTHNSFSSSFNLLAVFIQSWLLLRIWLCNWRAGKYYLPSHQIQHTHYTHFVLTRLSLRKQLTLAAQRCVCIKHKMQSSGCV